MGKKTLILISILAISLPSLTYAQGFGLFLNPIEERSLGTRYHNNKLAKGLKVYKDDRLASYIENIGRRIARKIARHPDQFVYTMVDDHSLNAFAAIGGYLYFHSGALLWLNDEAELAAILGHETGHAIKRHSAHSINRDNVSKSLLRLASLRRRNPEKLKELHFKAALALRGYGRENEFEADEVGARVLNDVGYDPYAAPRMAYQLHLHNLYAAKIFGGSDIPLALRTHPPSIDRVRKNLSIAKGENIKEYPRYRDRYLSMIDGVVLDLSIFGGPRNAKIRIHTVKDGETAQSIASRIPIKYAQDFLLAINGLDTGAALKAGMKIKIITR